jgi:hypothetical protein
MYKQLPLAVAAATLSALFTASPLAAITGGSDNNDAFTFDMVVSAGAKTCVPNATAKVTIRPRGPVEEMEVAVQGLPPKSEFDFFVIQVPKGPFGVSWYQGDIETDKYGRGFQRFVGRFQY